MNAENLTMGQVLHFINSKTMKAQTGIVTSIETTVSALQARKPLEGTETKVQAALNVSETPEHEYKCEIVRAEHLYETKEELLQNL